MAKLPYTVHLWYTDEERRLRATLMAMEGLMSYQPRPYPHDLRVQERAEMDYAFACWELAKARGLKRKDLRPRTEQLMQDGRDSEAKRLRWWLEYREMGVACNNDDVIHILACMDAASFMREWCRVRAKRDASEKLSGYRYFRFWMWCDKHDLRLKHVKEV